MVSESDEKFQRYFSGAELIGDDFTKEQIQAWFDDEAEGYADLGTKNKDQYRYVYHAWNKKHGFSWLQKMRYKNVLGIGGAYGHEFYPIADRIERITILDPSIHFETNEISGVPAVYKSPMVSGDLIFEDGSIDLLTCFGVLHHIPNVSYVIKEFGRVLSSEGVALIREPVVNMGDWRKPRKGLTARERGIPVHIMEEAIAKAGLKILARTPCDFPILSRLSKLIGVHEPYNSNVLVSLDTVLSSIFYFNTKYDRNGLFGRVCPCSVFWVCEKTERI